MTAWPRASAQQALSTATRFVPRAPHDHGARRRCPPRETIYAFDMRWRATTLAIHAQFHNLRVMEPSSYVSATGERLDATFFALADPTRRAILARLAEGEAAVGELADPFQMSQPAISKHLKVLERAGLVSVGQDGARRPRRLEPEPLAAAHEWIKAYREAWEASFSRLDALLDELEAAHRPSPVADGRPPTIHLDQEEGGCPTK